tara:strand:+ start:557 stop:733 length:177 start_codon:yes stop_codon:yes gene_type:complete
MQVHKITIKPAYNGGWVMNVEKHWDDQDDDAHNKTYVFTCLEDLARVVNLTLDEETEE